MTTPPRVRREEGGTDRKISVASATGKVLAVGLFASLGLYPWLVLAFFLADVSVLILTSVTLDYRTAPNWDAHEAFLKAGIFVVAPALAGAIGAYVAGSAFGLKGPVPVLAVGVLASATLLPFAPDASLWASRGWVLAGSALVAVLNWRRVLPRRSGAMAPLIFRVLWLAMVLSGSLLICLFYLVGHIGS